MAKKTNTQINGKKYFKISATVGTDIEGKRIRKYFYGESEKDAKRKRDEYLENINAGSRLDFDKVTFLEVFDDWFEHVRKPSVKENTYNRYEVEYKKRIKPSLISPMRLIDIKAIHIQKWYNQLIKDYSHQTVVTTHKLVKSFFIYCVNEDYLAKNPMRTVKVPAKEATAIKSDDERILSKIDIDKIKPLNDHNHFIFKFAMLTGLRQGEILALTRADVDLKQKVIHVTKTLNKDMLQPTTPKTESSVRTVPISDQLINPLKKFIINENKKFLKLGIKPEPTHPFFSSTTCGYRYARNVLRSWKRLCVRLKISECDFKILRATFCTMLAEKNIPIKTASDIMGHSNINTTSKFYTFAREESKRNAVNVL